MTKVKNMKEKPKIKDEPMTPEAEAHLASKWRGEFDQEITTLLERQDGITLEKIIEVLFQKGILDRLSPNNQKIKELRKKLRKDVYDETRNDPALYEKLFYAVECSRESLNYSTDVSWVNSSWLILAEVLRKQGLREKVFSGIENKNIDVEFLNRLQKRILKEYWAKGGARQLTPLPLGQKVIFRGIPATIDRYGPSGLIVLRAKTEPGHAQLYKFNQGDGLDPADVFSADLQYAEEQ